MNTRKIELVRKDGGVGTSEIPFTRDYKTAPQVVQRSGEFFKLTHGVEQDIASANEDDSVWTYTAIDIPVVP